MSNIFKAQNPANKQQKVDITLSEVANNQQTSWYQSCEMCWSHYWLKRSPYWLSTTFMSNIFKVQNPANK